MFWLKKGKRDSLWLFYPKGRRKFSRFSLIFSFKSWAQSPQSQHFFVEDVLKMLLDSILTRLHLNPTQFLSGS